MFYLNILWTLKKKNEINIYFIFYKNTQIQCTAKIHDLYYGETEKFIEEDRPQVYSPSLSYLSDEVNQRNGKCYKFFNYIWYFNYFGGGYYVYKFN